MNKFKSIFKRQYHKKIFIPFRCTPFGAYLDCVNDYVSGFAINKGLTFYFAQNNSGLVRIYSAAESALRSWELGEESLDGSWTDFCSGCIKVIAQNFPENALSGFDCYIESDLPSGLGVSSSASLTLGFLKILNVLNNLELSDLDLINYGVEVENKYIGVNCGKLDYASEVLGKANKLLIYNCQDDSYHYTGLPKGLNFAIVYSAVRHELRQSNFNNSIDNLNLDTKKQQYLIHERANIIAGENALKTKDFKHFGNIMVDSAQRFEEAWGVSSALTKKLLHDIIYLPGVHGARYSGSGIGGCILVCATKKGILNLKKAYMNTEITIKSVTTVDGIGHC